MTMKDDKGGTADPCRGRSRGRAVSRGGAAVEFALVLPIFLAVLFAMIDYGWYFYQRFTLAAAIRDGIHQGAAVQMSLDPCGTAITAAKADLSLAGSPINPTNVNWNLCPSYSGSSPNQFMTISGDMNFTPLVGFVKLPAKLSFQMTTLLEIQQ
ncbi:MAG TPA: TadE family protein [Polyangia bacterium]|nr:TadE family protein [Polyangia bacterium]